MQNEYILSFDLPKELDAERKRINRDLRGIDAKMIHHSFWKSEKLKELISIAQFIKNSGGKARILEEKLIF
jgi:hypothetical protein